MLNLAYFGMYLVLYWFFPVLLLLYVIPYARLDLLILVVLLLHSLIYSYADKFLLSLLSARALRRSQKEVFQVTRNIAFLSAKEPADLYVIKGTILDITTFRTFGRRSIVIHENLLRMLSREEQRELFEFIFQINQKVTNSFFSYLYSLVAMNIFWINMSHSILNYFKLPRIIKKPLIISISYVILGFSYPLVKIMRAKLRSQAIPMSQIIVGVKDKLFSKNTRSFSDQFMAALLILLSDSRPDKRSLMGIDVMGVNFMD
jgi:hypothetical protein